VSLSVSCLTSVQHAATDRPNSSFAYVINQRAHKDLKIFRVRYHRTVSCKEASGRKFEGSCQATEHSLNKARYD
jgi:hypothetical protein